MRSALLGLSFCLLACPGVLLAANAAEDHLKKADELHAQGYFDRARAEYEAALRLAGEDWHVLERLGFICFFKGEYQKAVEHFRQVIRLNPERRRLMLAYIAFAHYHMRDYSQVVDTLADRGGVSLIDIEQMRILAKRPPYQIEAKVDQTVLPFLQLDPLPMVQIEVNSKRFSVFVDTGVSNSSSTPNSPMTSGSILCPGSRRRDSPAARRERSASQPPARPRWVT